MQSARTVLFAADLSENSVEAFRVACSLAVEGETRLIVLHVIDPDRDEAGSTPGAEALRTTLIGNVREVYLPDRPLDVEYRLRVGSAPEQILRTADEVDADLIVMGTHGRTGLRRLLAGSVALDVLREARCSVLALRDHRRAPRTREIRVILHPTDFSKASEASLGVARSLARDLGAQLVVLHVIPLDLYLEGSMVAEIDAGDDQHSLDVIRQRLEGPDLKHPVETVLGRGRVHEQILGVAEDLACDLIVMGTHGRTGPGRLLMGSVAESIVPKADCAVLIVKAPRVGTVPAADRAAAKAELVP